MVRKIFLPLLVLTFVWTMVGCSQNPSEPTNTTAGDINADFGGYTATSEAPGFGDADLLADADGEVDYNDPLQVSPAVDSIMADSNAGFFVFRVAWGQLEYDSSMTTPTTWDGSLTISRGAELVRRVIRFEPGQDEVLPRTDRTLIEWVSQTTVHYDGLLVDMYFPRPVPMFDTTLTPSIDTLFDTTWVDMYDTTQTPEVDTLGDTTWVTVIDTIPTPEVDTLGGDTTWTTVVDTTMPDPVTVTFETGPYSRTFTLGELVALDTIVYLEDSNAVAFHAFKMDRLPCARGFLAGHWGRTEDSTGASVGVFRGMWMSRNGRVDGWLRGNYGRNEDGKHVFYGKWIDQSGNFEGLLSGTWGFQPNRHASDNARRHAGGWFAGKVYDDARSEIGILKGRFKGPDHPVKAAYFQGLWRLNCGDNAGVGWNDPGDRDHDGWEDNDNDHDGGDNDHEDDHDGGR